MRSKKDASTAGKKRRGLRASPKSRPTLKVGTRATARAKAAAGKPAAKTSVKNTKPSRSTAQKPVARRATPAPVERFERPKHTSEVGIATAPKRAKGRKKSSGKDDRGRLVALAIAHAALEKQAVDVEVIDVRGRADYADYIVVMGGHSDRQVNAIARGIQEEVKRKMGVACSSVEGLPQGSWVLMDFNDVVVHIFHTETRGYYDLEGMWLDAARLPVPVSA